MSQALELGPDFRLADPLWLGALWLALAAGLLLWWAAMRRRKLLRRLADPSLLPQLAGTAATAARLARAALAAIGLALLALGLARPQADPETREAEQLGRDVVFLVDVSRSMLAQDLAPNRLERAKIWINDLISELEGDRVGLVAFAGAASIRCPLTLDRGFLRLALNELGSDSAPRGGTLIGDAIRKTLDDLFDLTDPDQRQARDDQDQSRPPPRFRDIILITDGEDQESFPVRAAELAGSLGVRIIAIGIGSPDGARIPTPDDPESYLTYGGEMVRSRLDTDTLRQVAAASPGNVFLNVGAGEIDLAEVYQDLIASAEQTAMGSTETVVYGERFQWLLIPALLVLAIEAALPDARRRRRAGA